MKRKDLKPYAERLIILVCLACALVAISAILFLMLVNKEDKKITDETIDNNNGKYTSAPVMHPPESPQSLEFRSMDENSCAISGIGRYNGSELEIPSKSPLGETVIAIDKKAFEGCTELVSIEIPSSITRIGEQAFKGCSSLVHIEVDGDSESFSSVGGILYSKDKTKLICCPAARIGESYLVNPNVKSISDYAFYGVQNLRRIYYTGSTAQFESIKIGKGNDDFSSLPITCNYVSGK